MFLSPIEFPVAIKRLWEAYELDIDSFFGIENCSFYSSV